MVSSPSGIDESAKVAVLKDTGGEVTIAKNGRVTGLDEASEKTRQYIAQAALSEQIEPADILRHLSGEQSGLRGNDDNPQRFGLLYPVRSVVTEDRPVFRWENLPGASSYRIYVLDANGNQVGQSEELLPTQTQWKAPAALRRGQIFSGVVSAVVDGAKIISPLASAPEMKFAVLSAADFQELTSLKESNSHLALGVFYARTGLLDQAEREFESLIKLLKAINQSLELARRVDAKTREVELLWRAAQTYYAMQNYRESAALAEQALTLARSLHLPKLTYLATAALGDAYAADEKVELAITTLNEAINQVEELRNQVAGRREGRQIFFENKVGPYHTLVSY